MIENISKDTEMYILNELIAIEERIFALLRTWQDENIQGAFRTLEDAEFAITVAKEHMIEMKNM